jgi:hypothetical protein
MKIFRIYLITSLSPAPIAAGILEKPGSADRSGLKSPPTARGRGGA